MYHSKKLRINPRFRGDKPCESEGKTRHNLFVWIFVLVVMAAIAVGDVEQGSVTKENVEAIDVDVSGGDVSAGGMIQSITFKKDMKIQDALRFLALKYNRNIVPSPKVEGVLSFTSLRDVTFEDAMDAIMGMNLRYEQKGELIKVYTKDEYKKVMEDKERMISRVFTLYYISAAEAMKLINPVISSAGAIQGSSPAETVVPTGESISSGTAGGDTMALNDTIVILDYPENIAEAERLLKKLDRRPKQVLIEATILSAVLTEGMEFGIDWNTIDGLAVTKTNVEGLMADGLAGAITGVTGLTVGVSQDHVKVFIRAIESVTDTTVLANPKILAVNKQLGQVYIGNKIGYVSSTTQNESGSTTQEVEFLETGTKLSFRPYIGNDGYIRMDIQPKDSSGTLKTNEIPDESSTELSTNIMVKDGQTIVIGGLFRDVVVTSRNQIPLLGDLPLIGALFRGTSDETQRQEVIVMLTPHIISDPEETHGEARVEDISRKRFGAKDALQWIGRARLVEDRYANAAKYYLDGDSEAAMQELKTVLELRPSYLEAIRLKERIISETDPEAAAKIERNIVGTVEQEDTSRWQRR